MDPGWIVAAVALATAAITLIAWMFRLMWRLSKKVFQFLDDFYGQPAKPGHKPEPGVMERLQSLESSSVDILHQLHLNSGETLRDAVQRTERGVNEMRNDMSTLTDKVNRIGGGSGATP